MCVLIFAIMCCFNVLLITGVDATARNNETRLFRRLQSLYMGLKYTRPVADSSEALVVKYKMSIIDVEVDDSRGAISVYA